MSDKIIPFDFDRKTITVRPSEPLQENCSHRIVVADAAMRLLTCRKCGAKLDAFDWLISYGSHLTLLREECRRLEGRLQRVQEELASEEKNGRSVKAARK